TVGKYIQNAQNMECNVECTLWLFDAIRGTRIPLITQGTPLSAGRLPRVKINGNANADELFDTRLEFTKS
ncbi:MAG: hypothetical protein RRY34_10710, partial [Victivallaceae bacterium]